MSALFDFSTHITQLVRDEKYNDALEFFRDNKTKFKKQEIGNNKYLVSGILKCLRYTNYFDAGFQFLNRYNVEINNETEEIVLTSYGWLLWSKYKSENTNTEDHFETEINQFEDDETNEPISNFQYEKTDIILKIEELIPILYEKNTEYSLNLISFLFLVVLKSEKKKPTPNWKLINDFCNEFNPDNLSKKCKTIKVKRKGIEKDMELASDEENWYAYKTKALLKLGEWQECFDISKKALEVINNFHYSNDIWISRRIALSKKYLGNSKDAISELEIILQKKKEWFIQKELAELYFEDNNLESAFKYAIQAINNFGKLKFKVDLIFLIGKILNKKNEKDLAFKHFTLSKLIRQNEEWKIPQKVVDELKNFENKEININDFGKLKSELKKYWDSFLLEKRKSLPKLNGSQKGKIIRIINDNDRGKDGFLKCNNTDFYFSLSSNLYLTPKVEIGTKVEFNIKPSNDGKKDIARITKIVE